MFLSVMVRPNRGNHAEEEEEKKENRHGHTNLHSAPWSSLSILTNGFSGKQFSQTDGKSVVSHPDRFRSCLIWGGIVGAVLRGDAVAVAVAAMNWRVMLFSLDGKDEMQTSKSKIAACKEILVETGR